MAETTTVYVTRDIENHGIMLAEVLASHWASGSGDKTVVRSKSGLVGFLEDEEFFSTLPEAIADAERRRAKKIASLEKQIATMKALDLSTAVEG